MKLRLKKTLALMIALLLAMPSFAITEPLDAAGGQYGIPSEDIDAPVGEMDAFALGGTGEVAELPEMALQPFDSNAAEDPLVPAAFDQQVASPPDAQPTDEPTEGEGPAEEEPTDPQEPSPSGEGGSLEGETDEVVSPPDAQPTDEPTEGEGPAEEEPTSSDPSQGDGPASPEGEAPGTEETEAPEEPSDPDLPEPPAPVAFDQTVTVGDVAVTVKADAGAFPANAALSVKRVPVYKQRQADAAIEDVRDEDANVAVSYTFDIKVIDPETGAELQPAEGYAVQVSFALSEAGDDNLEANVYHVTDEGGELTAEKLDTDVDAADETITAATDGFSLYTVEFTYDNLQYVWNADHLGPTGERVLLSAILDAVGLTGTATAVTVSDAGIFTATNEDDDWVIRANGSFSTIEWLKVTINGITYKITVTECKITIITWHGSSILLGVDPSSTTVGEVKTLINNKNELRYPVDSQMLFFDNQLLNDDKETLFSYGVQSDSTL